MYGTVVPAQGQTPIQTIEREIATLEAETAGKRLIWYRRHEA